jgi:sugar/nucleoside kinase (ribokinase family)
MADVWVLGSAAWDYVYEFDHLPAAGTRTTARSLGRRPGGSSGNVARALASAGHAVHLVAQTGTDEIGDALLAELASYPVDTGYMLRYGECTPETLIFIDRAGERTILVIDKDCPKTVPVPHEAIAEADAVFVGCFADYGPRLPAILRHSRALVVTAVPPPGTVEDWCADIVIGSEADFSSAWLEAPYRHLRQRVGDRLRWVVVTRGAQGAIAYGPDALVNIPAVETVVVDTTGAGDSFTAGLMQGLLQGKDIATAGALGAHWAAVALKLPQSVPPRWSKLRLGAASGDWSARLAPQPGSHSTPVARTLS